MTDLSGRDAPLHRFQGMVDRRSNFFVCSILEKRIGAGCVAIRFFCAAMESKSCIIGPNNSILPRRWSQNFSRTCAGRRAIFDSEFAVDDCVRYARRSLDHAGLTAG